MSYNVVNPAKLKEFEDYVNGIIPNIRGVADASGKPFLAPNRYTRENFNPVWTHTNMVQNENDAAAFPNKIKALQDLRQKVLQLQNTQTMSDSLKMHILNEKIWHESSMHGHPFPPTSPSDALRKIDSEINYLNANEGEVRAAYTRNALANDMRAALTLPSYNVEATTLQAEKKAILDDIDAYTAGN